MATSTLSRIESGERGLSFEHLTPLAAALDISLHELLEPDRHARTPDTPPEPVNIDLRKLRYFAVLAEDLHFGRAAERLSITQPALSRQMQKLELELGVNLLTRSSRYIELTDAGRQLLEDAHVLLATADATGERVRRAASRRPPITVGFLVGDPIISVVRAYNGAHPDAEVEVHRIYWYEQPAAILNNRVDVSFVHLPMEEDGLDFAYLYSVPRVALLPADHRLADRTSVSIADLADDPVVRHRGASPIWESWNSIDPRPDGRRPRRGPEVGNLEETIEAVGTGRAIGFVPASVTTALQMPPEVIVMPVADIAPTEVCLAWNADRRSETIRDLVTAAHTVSAPGLPLRYQPIRAVS